MGRLARLLGLERKASAVGGLLSAFNLGRPVWTERDYAKFADEAYVRNAIGFRCVKMISTAAATAPWLLYSGDKELDRHPLLDLLSRPGPMVGGHQLFEAFYAYFLLSGDAYLEGVGPKTGAPKELWNLRSDRMQVIPGPMGLPSGYKYTVNGQSRTWDVDPVKGRSPILHVKGFHPLNDWYGLSRVDPAAYGIDRHNAASAHNKALLDNGARPSGALIFKPVKGKDGDQSAPADVIKAAEHALDTRHGGPKNAGKPLVLGGNIDWQEMGISPKDMDFAAGKDDAARDICTSFGVPHILIVHGESTYNNRREARLEFWEETILPILDLTVDELNAWLVPKFGEGLRLDIDKDKIEALEPRREAKRASTVTLFKEGVINNAEAREALQYGPRDPDAVGHVDAQVLASLVKAVVEGEDAMFAPLFRYLKSVGLLEPTETLDGFTGNWAAGALPDDVQGMIDGKPPKPNGDETLKGSQTNGDAQT